MAFPESKINKVVVIELPRLIEQLQEKNELDKQIDNLISTGEKYIAVSFKHLSYIGSLIIGVLLRGANKLKKINGEIFILEPNKEIVSFIEFISVIKTLKVFKSIEDLKKHFK